MNTKARDPRVWAKTRYFDIHRNWGKLESVFESGAARSIWHPCIEEFEMRHAAEHKFTYKPRPNAEYPCDYDGCDWRFDTVKVERPFWKFARHAACHWVVDLALYVAKTSRPQTPWRILHAQKHSTVWNGCTEKPVLFDINFHAMGISAPEAMDLASHGREMKIGKYLKPYLHSAP